jgi:outer membrane lipoprotein LolB
MKSAGCACCFALVSLLFISGCATAPPSAPLADPAAAWQARQTALRAVTAWRLQGRLALRAAEEGWQADIAWVREGARQQIDLSGPLGRGHLRLTQDGSGAELRDAQRRRWRAANAGELLYRVTGWFVPLDGLDDWMLGLPAPGPVAQLELDDQGRLKTLVQSGWDIRFLRYARQDGLDLPEKIFMKRQGGTNAQDAAVQVHLLIERWTLDEKNSPAPAAR